MLLLKVLCILSHTETIRDQKTRKVVASRGLKQYKSIKPSAPNSGRGRLQEMVVYERFQL